MNFDYVPSDEDDDQAYNEEMQQQAELAAAKYGDAKKAQPKSVRTNRA